MEQPSHDLRLEIGGSVAQAAPRRVGGMVIVGAVHVLMILGLIAGLKSGVISKLPKDIEVALQDEKVEEVPPPPPPPDVIKPPPPFVPPPAFEIAVEAPPTQSITTTTQRPPPAEVVRPAPPPTTLSPIRSTFTLPPYPTISQRLGEQGTTTLKITISTEGRVTVAEVQKTSGSARLDQAAVDWVKARYRYRPPTQNGQPTEAITLLNIVWNLKDAQ